MTELAPQSFKSPDVPKANSFNKNKNKHASVYHCHQSTGKANTSIKSVKKLVAKELAVRPQGNPGSILCFQKCALDWLQDWKEGLYILHIKVFNPLES